MINKIIEQAYIKKKVFKKLSEISHNRKFQFTDRLRESIILKPTNKLPDTELNLHQKAIRISNTPIDGYSISPEAFKELKVPEGTKENPTLVLFERGQVYNFGEKDITAANVKVRGYGAGVDSAIRGSQDASTLEWTDEGGGIYSTPMAERPDWVWIDDICAKQSETARIAIISRPSTTEVTIADSAVSGFTTIVGSRIVLKDQKYRNGREEVVASYTPGSPNGTIAMSASPGGVTTGNVDLVLYGLFEFLSGNNEWAWEAGELRVKASSNPETINIRTSAYKYCFQTTQNTEFSDLEFKEYYAYSIRGEGTTSAINVHDCYSHDNRGADIFVKRRVTGVNISNNTFERTGNHSIVVRPLIDSIISGNTINGAGMQDNYGWPLSLTDDLYTSSIGGTGIVLSVDIDDTTIDGSNINISGNNITNCAYCCIAVAGNINNIVADNTLTNFMYRFTDGGGLYMNHVRTHGVAQSGSEIYGNIIHGGNSTGETAGIYEDNGMEENNFHDNTVYECDYGMLANFDTRRSTITDNIFFNNSIAQLWISDRTGEVLFTTNDGNVVTGNRLVCNNSTQRCLKVDTDEGAGYNPYANGGSADNNKYINRFTNQIANTNIGSNRTLAQLQGDYSQDSASVYRENFAGLVTNETNATVNSTIDQHALQLVAASMQTVNLGTTSDIQFTHISGLAIYLEFKKNGNPAAGQALLSNFGPVTNRGYQISMGVSGQISVEFRNTATTNRYTYLTANGFADNEWHSLLILKPSNHLNTDVKVDGVSSLQSETDNLTATIASVDDLIIGDRESIGVYFDGQIRRIHIWGTDQTANAASILAAAAKQQNLDTLGTKPIHSWQFADSFNDSGTSVNPLDGTGQNSPTIIQPTYDVDLNALTNYSLPAHSGLVYLLN